MKAARIGARTVDIERAAEAVVKAWLFRLNLITDVSGPQFRTRYTHGICHAGSEWTYTTSATIAVRSRRAWGS
jgi:hypothetical protein